MHSFIYPRYISVQSIFQFSWVQSLSRVFAAPWAAAQQAYEVADTLVPEDIVGAVITKTEHRYSCSYIP